MKRFSTSVAAAALIAGAFALPAQAQETEIVVHYAMPGVFGGIQEEIAARFMEENPDVRVTFRSPSDSYEDGVQRVLRESMSGDTPDIVYVGLNRIRILAERELAQPLAPFIDDPDAFAEAGFTDSLLGLGQVRGTQYGLAFAASTPVVYYNADLVAQAGGDPDAFPDNWDDLIALGAQIDALGDDIDGIYYHFWGSDWMWQAAVGSFGGELMDEAEEVVLFDDERGHRAAALLARFRDEAGMPAYDRSAAQQSFQAGRLGIKLDSSAFLARMEDGVGDRFDLRVASFPVADRENGWLPTGGAGIVMITDDEARQEAAWRYMTFAAGPEGAAIVVRNSGYAPTNQRAADDPQFLGDFYAENPNHQATRDQVAFLGPWFAYPGERGVRVTDTIMSTLRDVLDTDADPAQTLDALADTVRAELAR